jgi:hypothetical protein
VFWWIRYIFFAALAIFFLEFGIEEILRSYGAKNPSEFLAWFFSASFIILISGTLLVAFIWKMVLRFKGRKDFEGIGGKGPGKFRSQ